MLDVYDQLTMFFLVNNHITNSDDFNVLSDGIKLVVN